MPTMLTIIALLIWIAAGLVIARMAGINERTAMPDTQPPVLNRRTNALMREHVELVAWCREVGHITTRHAGEMLARAGVPFEVACRVLRRRAS